MQSSMGFLTNLDELYCKPRRGHQPFSRGSFASLDDANASQTQFDMFLYVSSTLAGSSSKGIFLLATLATVATHSDILDILPASGFFSLQTSTSFLASLEDLFGKPRGALMTDLTRFPANFDEFSCKSR